MSMVKLKNFLKGNPLTARLYQKLRTTMQASSGCTIGEIEPLVPRQCQRQSSKLRLNIITPSVDIKHVFGGISTAMKLFYETCEKGGFDARVIVVDAPVFPESSVLPKEYEIVKPEKHKDVPFQVVPMHDRHGKTFPVAENDIFMATGWWTAYTVSDVIRWQKEVYGVSHPLVYMIQDYEPGFYPWSSRYLMADSTYRSDLPVYAVLNSKLLSDFFTEKGYTFEKSWSFDPKLNESLLAFLPEQGTKVEKKKQILVYGRPSTARNAFELLVYGLREWVAQQEDAKEWTVLSAGEMHDDIPLGEGVVLHSVGKLTLEEYARVMLDTYAGVSLMVSPHPSYPPLEMATFGIQTITNGYDSKNLSGFSENIVSLTACAPRNIAEALSEICSGYDGLGVISTSDDYLIADTTFGTIPQELAEALKQ